MIAHYALLERLGVSGLGEVFRARDTRTGRTVALTLISEDLLTDSAEFRVFSEAVRAASTLSHPNIATLFEAGEHEGRRFLVQELPAGSTLRQELGGGPMNLGRALDLTIQTADALADAHARNLAHGDLRPETIIVTSRGSAKILDFGFTQWSDAAKRGDSSRSVDPSPASAYRPPGEALDQPVDERIDLYSLAVVLYEMLTGRLPFEPSAETTGRDGTPRPPSHVNPAVPAALDRVVLRALSIEPQARYRSAATFSAALRAVVAMPKGRSGDREIAEPAEVPDEPPRRAPWAVIVVVIMIALVLWWYVR